MATTITKSTSVSLNGTATAGGINSSLSATLSEISSGGNISTQQQSLATGTWAAVAVGGFQPDLVCIKNLDPTNYVQIALDNAGAHIVAKLNAGRICFIPLDPSATLYAQPNSAICVIQILAIGA